jgi:hypothetical protein
MRSVAADALLARAAETATGADARPDVRPGVRGGQDRQDRHGGRVEHADAAGRTAPVPEPSFRHLHRMSDDVGLFEHARRATPLRDHAYCVDDVSRGLLVLCREPDPDDALISLAETYLSFLQHAQGEDGSFHNRMGFDREWHDEPTLGDWWGHALWGLGTAAARGPEDWMRENALEYFEAGVHLRTPWSRSMAFAALGAAEVLTAYPDHRPARRLLGDAARMIGRPRRDPLWPWPEPRLRYANAALPEVLIAAGEHLQDRELLEDGLLLLEWLLKSETHDGHLSLTPVDGWRTGEPRPAFDQQPIEAAAMADACARAFDATWDPRWAEGVNLAVSWFLGDNDTGVPLWNEHTGGGCDGLKADGRNENQGAESTLALISALQLGRRFAGRP